MVQRIMVDSAARVAPHFLYWSKGCTCSLHLF
nr:MAG TPA: hypothetical protein [Caudoviricetes sp.]